MKLHKKLTLSILGLFAVLFGAILANTPDASAVSQLVYSPIRQNKVLVPGTSDYLSLYLSVPSDSEAPVDYELEIRPFSMENGEANLVAKENYSLIADWITLPEEDRKGSIKPNETKTINYTIDTPKNAPAGGQYAAIIIKTHDNGETGILQVYEMTHMIYAEVAGETSHGGEVLSTSLPSFITSGNLTAGATIKNQGNVHATVRHILKVFPLIGNEEFFTNEEEEIKEEDVDNLILPGATRYTAVTWENTPTMGIFRVEYTVEFEGVKNEISKIVIVCPIWLLVIILAILAILIFRIVTHKSHRKSESRSEAA